MGTINVKYRRIIGRKDRKGALEKREVVCRIYFKGAAWERVLLHCGSLVRRVLHLRC
jgi:hypothetical protein